MKPLDSYYDSAIADSGPGQRLLVWLGEKIVGTGITVLFRARYEGLEVFDRLPEGKAAIIAGNHSSYADPMFVFKAIWPRRVRFMAKGKLFEHKFLDRILANFGVFPVYSDTRGRQAIKRSIACLQRGEHVGIFPEGTRIKSRDKTGVELNDGVALIAKMADVLIIPVGLEGPLDISPNGSKLLHFPKVILRFGEPVDYKEFVELGLQKQELFRAVTEETMRRVYALVEGCEPGPAPMEEYAARAAEAPKRRSRKAAAKDAEPAGAEGGTAPVATPKDAEPAPIEDATAPAADVNDAKTASEQDSAAPEAETDGGQR